MATILSEKEKKINGIHILVLDYFSLHRADE